MKLRNELTEREYVISSIIKEDGKDVFVQQYRPKNIIDYQLALKLVHMIGTKAVPVEQAATRLKLSCIEDKHGVRPTVEGIVEKHPLEFKIVQDGKKQLIIRAR